MLPILMPRIHDPISMETDNLKNISGQKLTGEVLEGGLGLGGWME